MNIEKFKKAKTIADKLKDAGASQCLLVGGWVRDHILGIENKDFDNALRYAISVYVLYDHSTLASESMLIAIKTLLAQDRVEDAQKTYQELEARFPVKLAAFKSDLDNAQIFDQLLASRP